MKNEFENCLSYCVGAFVVFIGTVCLFRGVFILVGGYGNVPTSTGLAYLGCGLGIWTILMLWVYKR